MDKKIKEQILAIRETGQCNMLDIKGIQKLVFERDLFELVLFLEDSSKEYLSFILYGKESK
jgi:virulence-related protein